MSATEIVCPHCRYDLPASGYNRNTKGIFASSAIAQGQFMNGLLVYPIAYLLQLGMLVVFIRVQH
jgi:hypothetical protein